MPTGGQHGLDILRPLIDGLIPREPSLLREARHRLDELIDLRAQHRLPVAGLDRFDLGCGGSTVPILDRHTIGGPMNGKPQVVGLPANDQIQWINPRIVKNLVCCAAIVLNKILPLASTEEDGVVAAASVHRIVP